MAFKGIKQIPGGLNLQQLFYPSFLFRWPFKMLTLFLKNAKAKNIKFMLKSVNKSLFKIETPVDFLNAEKGIRECIPLTKKLYGKGLL